MASPRAILFWRRRRIDCSNLAKRGWASRAPAHSDRIPRKREFFYGLAPNQMFLNDSLQDFGCAGVIPNAFGIDDGDRTMQANAQAVSFGPIDQRFSSDEV